MAYQKGDVVLADWKKANLLFPSWVRAKLVTLSPALVRYRPGRLSKRDLAEVGEAAAAGVGIVKPGHTQYLGFRYQKTSSDPAPKCERSSKSRLLRVEGSPLKPRAARRIEVKAEAHSV